MGEVSSKIVETKNKLIFNKLVKTHWGLSKKGYALFKHRLFFDRQIAKEYKEIIGDAPDLRRRIDLSNEEGMYSSLMDGDEGFNIFSNIFRDVKSRYSISYENFNKGKFKKDKNEVKLFKGIKKFYFDAITAIYDKDKKCFSIETIEDNNNLNDLLKFISCFFSVKEHSAITRIALKTKTNLFFKETFGVNIGEDSSTVSDVSRCYFSDGKIYLNIAYYNTYYIELDTKEKFEKIIDFIIKESSELIGKYKLPNKKKLEMVISLNPVDWLLCSTGEKWSSCLSLDSSYMFWGGIPTMLGDKNRALVYITDGRKKKYMGMEVDGFLTRSWVLLTRRKAKNKERTSRKDTFLNVVREYPSSYGIENMLKKYLNFNILENRGDRIIGKYYIETINFQIGNYEGFKSLYLDSCFMEIAKKNKAKYVPMEYVRYKFGSAGGTSSFVNFNGEVYKNKVYYMDDEEIFDDSDYDRASGIKGVIEENLKISSCLGISN